MEYNVAVIALPINIENPILKNLLSMLKNLKKKLPIAIQENICNIANKVIRKPKIIC